MSQLFSDWFAFFARRDDDRRLAWMTAILMVAAPIFCALLAADFVVSELLGSERIFSKMNRWVALALGGGFSYGLAGIATGKLRYDEDTAAKLASRPPPTRLRTVRNVLQWYLCPLALFVVIAALVSR